MKIIFTGIGINGITCLKGLINNGWRIDKVIIPQGYDVQEIKNVVLERKIKHVETKGKKELESEIIKSNSDLLIVASCPYLFSDRTINSVKKGAVNIHGSMLPDYRGYHPVHWAIINGETSTGVTLHYINKDVDKGDIIAQRKILIHFSDDIHTLIKKISQEGVKLLIKNLPAIEKGNEKRLKQVENSKIKAQKRKPDDSKVNWKKYSSKDIFNLSRALQEPYPLPFTSYKKRKLEITSTYKSKKPGKIVGMINQYFLVETIDGLVAIAIKNPGKLKVGDVLS